MNKLALTSALVFCLLLAACGGGSSGGKASTVEVVNNAPVIDMTSTQRITAGQVVDFSVGVSDPDGDSVTVVWQADNAEVTFSTTTDTSTKVSFPDSSIEQVIKISVTATDSKGKSSVKTMTVTLEPSIASNLAPTISLPGAQEARGGQSIVLVATVQDPEGDIVSIEWRANNNALVFSDPQSLTPTLMLPEVTSVTIITITLIATDSHNNSSEKTLILTIVPSDTEPTPNVQFELAERFETTSGDVTRLTAQFTSNVETTAITWNLSSFDDVDASEENSSVNGVTTTTVTFTAPSLTVAKEYAISLDIMTVSGVKFSADSRVFVAVDNAMSLEVVLAETYAVDEESTLTITPEINNSHAIDSYLWQWFSDQEITLSTPTNKVLSLIAPDVDADIAGQLSLTVTMGTLSKTVMADLTIKNDLAPSDVNVTASKYTVVQGQTIELTVGTDNFQQITSWSWENINLQGENIQESKTGYEITAPQVEGQKTMSVIYRATLSDGSTVQEVGNFTVLSKSMARSSIDMEVLTVPPVKSNEETVIDFPFTDRHGLVDSLSLNTDTTFNSFDKAEVALVDGKVRLVLAIGDFDLPVDHSDYITVMVKFGVHEIPFVIQLSMISK